METNKTNTTLFEMIADIISSSIRASLFMKEATEKEAAEEERQTDTKKAAWSLILHKNNPEVNKRIISHSGRCRLKRIRSNIVKGVS